MVEINLLFEILWVFRPEKVAQPAAFSQKLTKNRPRCATAIELPCSQF